MENNQAGNKKIYMAIIALLLLMNGVAVYLLWSENKEKKDVIETKVQLEEEFKSLTANFDAKVLELEGLKGQNAELDSVISAQQVEIDRQKQQIQSLFAKGKMSASELAKAKEMIAQYEVTIADMKAQIEALVKKNELLTNENQQLSTDLNAEKQTTILLGEQNKGLSKKVELGSLLQLRNIEVLGTRKKGNGKEVTVKKGKQVESMKISFETGENKVLENGPLSLAIRIINPKGETITVADQGSGSFKLADSEEVVQYTKKADFDWTQSNKKVVVYWSQGVNLEGTYRVEVYQSGYLIGKGSVENN
jgi:uncharacterized coiled-coil protein SlyX